MELVSASVTSWRLSAVTESDSVEILFRIWFKVMRKATQHFIQLAVI
jgi:hypothetical protein